jgi:4-amino-4-deoxy-L-arabinose transferase-like glycosyltransferase
MNPGLKTWQYNAAITLLAALLFMPFLGGVHLFDWDEINFAESAREMITTRDYLTVQINFVPFWEKPPLFIWMQVLSMKLFGINEFAARFPNAVCGIISLLVLFNTGRKVLDIRFGLIWVMLYGGSMLPFLYFKSGIIDPWFNLFIFLGIYQIYLYFAGPLKATLHALGAGLFIGLAILTKGPVALLVFTITVGIILLIKRFRVNIRFKDVLLFILVLSVIGGMWFILQILKGNFNIIADFIEYQIRLFKTKDAGHGGFLFYHFVVLLIGVFPAAVFALPGLINLKRNDSGYNAFYSWMYILFWVVLLLFTIVRTKIVHYSSLCYFPLTFIAAWSVYHMDKIPVYWKRIYKWSILILGIAWALIITSLTFIEYYKDYLSAKIEDPFAVACLRANSGWSGFEWLTGMVLLTGIFLFARLWNRKKIDYAVTTICCATAVFMFSTTFMIVPHIEAYSQRAAVEFFQSVSRDDVYLETIGYKSYAHLFYGKAKEQKGRHDYTKEWLLKGRIDKPVYFSVKITRKEKFSKDYPGVSFLYEKNGFAFYKRTPDGE